VVLCYKKNEKLYIIKTFIIRKPLALFKSIIFFTSLFFVLGCKKKLLKEFFRDSAINYDEVVLPSYSLWGLKNTSINLSDKYLYDEDIQVFSVKRLSNEEPAFVYIREVPIYSGKRYGVSVMAKKTISPKSAFGLRIVGNYPNRVDAIFNLATGNISGVSDYGEVFNSKANVEDFGDDWFKFSLSAIVNYSSAQIIFGPTSDLMNTYSWESSTSQKDSVFIIPSSLKLELLTEVP